MRPYNYLAAIINFIVSAIEVLLGLRLVFRFFGANSDTPFVRWIYDTSAPLLGPFRGIFPTTELEGRYVLEFTTVIAMLVYGLIGYFLVYLVSSIATPADDDTVEERVVRRRR